MLSSERKINSKEMFDILGNKVFLKVGVNSSFILIPVSLMSKGIYSFALKDEKGNVVVRRVVVN